MIQLRLFAAVFLAITSSAASAEETVIRIGTGGKTGVYFPTGGAVCRLVNRNTAEHGVSCLVESTGGSVSNIQAIRAGTLDFGIVQSDWQYHAVNGTSRFEDVGAFTDLRAVVSLHPEPFTVLARADSGINSFEDLKGKRVNIGNPGSGSRGTMEVVMAAKGISVSDFLIATELKSADQARAVCENKIDAMVFTVGHPSGSIKDATTQCETVLVNVAGPEIEALIDQNPYYRTATIPGGMYQGNVSDIATFGVGATLVSSTTVPEEVVYVVTKAIFENFSRFKRLHPALGVLKEDEMRQDGLSAPLHNGALAFFRERGWAS